MLNVNDTMKGAGKLVFYLPISESTKNVLIIGELPGSLIERLDLLGLELFSGLVSSPFRLCQDGDLVSDTDNMVIDIVPLGSSAVPSFQTFDIIVVANLACVLNKQGKLCCEIDCLLTPNGFLVTFLENKFSYKRFTMARLSCCLGSIFRGDIPVCKFRYVSLNFYLKEIKKRSGRIVNIYSPFPDLYNPSLAISLLSNKPLLFLIDRFQDFSEKRSFFFKSIVKLFIFTSIYKFLLNEYIVISQRKYF
jgi:hypothetical protein